MTTETRAFGRYELRGVLGNGGFATVYRAYDPALQRDVALKTLLPHLAADPTVRARFLAEARALAALHHPNIVTIYDVGETDGLPFFAMELIEGSSLAARLGSGTPPADRALFWLSNLASALDYLHAAGLVHRDVKPANIMIGPGGQAVLMDLSVARNLGGTQYTQTGVSLGTPAYMSPEQVRGQPAGPAADIYALGILAFALLTGHAPFQGDTAAVLHAQVYEPPPLAGLQPIYAAALAKALAKDPELRPANAGAFVALLRDGASPDATLPYLPGASDGSPTLLDPTYPVASPPTPPPLQRGPHARAGLLLVCTLALVTLLVATILLVLTHRSTSTPAIVAARVPTATAASTSVAPPVTSATAVATPTASTASVTATSAAPTQQPIAPSSPPGFVATSVTIDSSVADAWAAGGSALNVRLAFQNAPEAATLLLRISPAGDPADPVTQGDATALGAPNGTVELSAPAVGVVPAGNYVALVYDASWHVVQSYTFAVSPPAVQRTPVGAVPPPVPSLPAAPNLAYPTIGGSGSSPQIVAITPESGAIAGGTFSFVLVARNGGATSGSGSITVSSPDATAIVATPINCNVTNMQPMSEPPGARDTIFVNGGVQTGALSYPLGEIDFDAFPAGAQCSLRVVVTTSPAALALRLYLRTTVFGAGRTVVSWPAVSGTLDQQNLPVIPWNIPLR
jgi:serine/threonine-protein kinase